MSRDTLLLDLYASAGQPWRWTRVLDRLCEETGACSAVAQSFGFTDDGVRLGWQATDTRTATRLAPQRPGVADHRNPRLDRRRGLRGLNRVVRDEQLFDRGDPACARLHEQLATVGLGEFIGALEALPDGRYLGIALHRAVDDHSAFQPADAQRLAELAPHFGQACDLGRQLDNGRQRLAQWQRQLDLLCCGLVICDTEARVQWMNRSAQARLGAARAVLQLGQRSQATYLRDEIAAACAASASAAPRFVALEAGGEPLHIAMRACGDGDGAAGDGASVLMAITSPRDSQQVPPTAWCKLLGVTPAEAELVAALARGDTLEQHAGRRGVAIGTVRGQLKQVLAKTGTSRQADLVRLALSSAAAHVLASVPDWS